MIGNRSSVLRLVLFATATMLLAQPATAAHRQRARTRCCLPRYNYGHDTPRSRETALAVADAVETNNSWRELNLSNIAQTQRNRLNYGRPISTVPVKVLRKPFHVEAESITARHATLEQIGIAIYENGHLESNGRISHDGGPNAGLLGGNVVIRLRAFAAHPVGRELLDPTVVWSSEHRVWVAREKPRMVSLVPPHAEPPAAVRRFFDRITHIEVELEYEQDR